MEQLREWWDRSLEVVTTPTPFYAESEPADEYMDPLRFASVSAAVPAAVLAVLGLLGNLGRGVSGITGAIGVFLFIYIAGMYFFVVRTAVTDTLLRVVDGDDMVRTLDALSAASVLTLTLGWIPLVNLFTGVYAVYVESRGLEQFNDVSMPAAIIAILAGSLLSLVVGAAVLGIVVGTVGGVTGLFA
ncbi:MAG: hypothetical protein SVY41_00960 [Candidatus Nanohaloarchaea archaeon]|nr:hypothetical protein [Candidatus Nanohaloarchaea archaeon]